MFGTIVGDFGLAFGKVVMCVFALYGHGVDSQFEVDLIVVASQCELSVRNGQFGILDFVIDHLFWREGIVYDM